MNPIGAEPRMFLVKKKRSIPVDDQNPGIDGSQEIYLNRYRLISIDRNREIYWKRLQFRGFVFHSGPSQDDRLGQIDTGPLRQGRHSFPQVGLGRNLGLTGAWDSPWTF